MRAIRIPEIWAPVRKPLLFVLRRNLVRSRFMTALGMACVALLVFVSSGKLARAQEGEMTVVDEVIAQANDEVAKHQAELVATLVNEKLLLQKGKELDLASEIESEVNRRMLDIAHEQGINSIQKLEEFMVQNKINPATIRETMRSEMMKQAVLQQEV